MDKVFLLWHVHALPDHDDEKLIGVYTSKDQANLARSRVADEPGFKQHPEGFSIAEYELNKDHWTEGFVTV